MQCRQKNKFQKPHQINSHYKIKCNIEYGSSAAFSFGSTILKKIINGIQHYKLFRNNRIKRKALNLQLTTFKKIVEKKYKQRKN